MHQLRIILICIGTPPRPWSIITNKLEEQVGKLASLQVIQLRESPGSMSPAQQRQQETDVLYRRAESVAPSLPRPILQILLTPNTNNLIRQAEQLIGCDDQVKSVIIVIGGSHGVDESVFAH